MRWRPADPVIGKLLIYTEKSGAVWNENLSSLPSFSQGLYFASSFNVKTASYLICTFRSNVRQVSLFHAY